MAEVAPEVGQQAPGGLVGDALGDTPQSERVCHVDSGRDDRRVVAVLGHTAHESLVNLDLGEGDPAQMLQG